MKNIALHSCTSLVTALQLEFNVHKVTRSRLHLTNVIASKVLTKIKLFAFKFDKMKWMSSDLRLSPVWLPNNIFIAPLTKVGNNVPNSSFYHLANWERIGCLWLHWSYFCKAQCAMLLVKKRLKTNKNTLVEVLLNGMQTACTQCECCECICK